MVASANFRLLLFRGSSGVNLGSDKISRNKHNNLIENNLKKEGSIRGCYTKESAILNIDEYRKITGDYSRSEKQILKKLNYLEALSRNIINVEIMTYVEKRTKPTSK